jgi:hypothetical protein
MRQSHRTTQNAFSQRAEDGVRPTGVGGYHNRSGLATAHRERRGACSLARALSFSSSLNFSRARVDRRTDIVGGGSLPASGWVS